MFYKNLVSLFLLSRIRSRIRIHIDQILRIRIRIRSMRIRNAGRADGQMELPCKGAVACKYILFGFFCHGHTDIIQTDYKGFYMFLSV